MAMGRFNIGALRSFALPGPTSSPQHLSLFEKQRKFMFNARLVVPFLNSTINALMPSISQYIDLFTYSVIATNLPGKDREFEVRRFMNETWTTPKGEDWDHKWECSIRVSELGFELDILRYWFNYVRVAQSLEDAKGSVRLELIKLDGQTVNRVFDLRGLYPTNIPEVKDLNHDEKTGSATAECSFAFDKINYGVLDTIFDLLNTFGV